MSDQKQSTEINLHRLSQSDLTEHDSPSALDSKGILLHFTSKLKRGVGNVVAVWQHGQLI